MKIFFVPGKDDLLDKRHIRRQGFDLLGQERKSHLSMRSRQSLAIPSEDFQRVRQKNSVRRAFDGFHSASSSEGRQKKVKLPLTRCKTFAPHKSRGKDIRFFTPNSQVRNTPSGFQR